MTGVRAFKLGKAIILSVIPYAFFLFGCALVLNEHMDAQQNRLGVVMIVLSLPFVIRDFRRAWMK